MVTLEDWLAIATITVGGAVAIFAVYLGYFFQLKAARADKRRELGAALIANAWELRNIAKGLALMDKIRRETERLDPKDLKDRAAEIYGSVLGARTSYGPPPSDSELFSKAFGTRTMSASEIVEFVADSYLKMTALTSPVREDIGQEVASLMILGVDPNLRTQVHDYVKMVRVGGPKAPALSPEETGSVLGKKMEELETYLMKELG